MGFCQDLIFDGQVPFYRDLTNYFYPLRHSYGRVSELANLDYGIVTSLVGFLTLPHSKPEYSTRHIGFS